MARYALIDGYLDTMRNQIRWRRDLDDLVYEMEDHLYSTVEGLLALGIEPRDAQRTTLDRFGEPDVLAAVYASNDSGGIAVPTRNTHRAGTVAIVAAAFWIATAVFYTLMVVYDASWELWYGAFSATVLISGVLTVLAMIGVSKRLGGLGIVGMIGLAITALGVLASVVAWAVPFWMAFQGLGYLTFGLAVLRRREAPRASTLLVTSGFAIGGAAFVLLNLAEVGWRDSFGDYPLAWALGLIAGTVFLPLGLVGWGRWLRSEEPVDIDATPIAA